MAIEYTKHGFKVEAGPAQVIVLSEHSRYGVFLLIRGCGARGGQGTLELRITPGGKIRVVQSIGVDGIADSL